MGSAWQASSGGGFTDELLAWPPDVFALTHVLLDRSEAFRFALSPQEGCGGRRLAGVAHELWRCWPRRRLQVDVLHPRVCPEATGGQLVPGGLESGSLHACIA
jgi:hypothetical protein